MRMTRLLVVALALSIALPVAAQFSVRNPTDTFRSVTATHALTANSTATVTLPAPLANTGGGTVGGTGNTAAEYQAALRKTVITFDDHSITMTDATTAGSHGSTKIYDFPAGAIQVLGSSCDLTTTAGAGGIDDAAEAVLSLGSATAGTDNATLTSTEADIIASYAGTLSSGTGVFTKYGSLVAAAFDGTTTPVDLYINAAVPDAGSTADDTLTVAGTCTIAWANLGDF